MTAVHITNPDLPKAKPALTTQDAFDAVWKDKGWKIVSPTEALKIERELDTPAAADAPVKAAKTVGGAA